MPATRSILSVIRLMLEANLPQAEILRTLNACLSALPPLERHPDDRAPTAVPVPIIGDSGDNGINRQPPFTSAQATYDL